MPTKSAEPRTDNWLLGSLAPQELKRLLPKLERVELIPRNVLYDPGKPIQHIYFPEAGVVSLVSKMKDGSSIEVGTVGKEGMVGLPILLGATSTPLQVFAQIPGHALRLQADAFKREVQNGTSLEQILQRYTQALFTQLSQSVACNRLHSVEQRCARWLLLTADRVGQQAFKLTQEFLAQMLGVRRASVNPILQNFQKNGIIKYKQGQMELRKRRALERVSCECYEIVRREYQKLIGKG